MHLKLIANFFVIFFLNQVNAEDIKIPLNLADWGLLGDAKLSSSELQLNDFESQKEYSLIWYKNPINYSKFQIEFTLEVSRVNQSNDPLTIQPLGWALWLTDQKPPYALNETRILGSKASFNGFGMFFSYFDAKKKLNPSISGGFNKGDSWSLYKDVPATGYYWDFRVHRKLMIKIVVEKDSIIGFAKHEDETHYINIFHLTETLPRNPYLSFSSEIGNKEPNNNFTVDTIILHDLSVVELVNNNTSKNININQDFVTLPHIDGQLDVHNLKNLNHKDKLLVSSEVLSLQLHKIAYEIIPFYKHVGLSLNILESAVYSMFKQFADLYRLLPQSLDSKQKEKAQTIVKEITELKRIIQSHSKAFHEISHVQDLITPYKDEKGEKMEIINKTIYKQHKTNWILFMFFISTLTFIGLFIWKKATDLERKHMY